MCWLSRRILIVTPNRRSLILIPQVSYDAETDALLVRFSQGRSSATVAASDSVNVDFDAEGRLVALEVLSASKLAPELVQSAQTRQFAAE